MTRLPGLVVISCMLVQWSFLELHAQTFQCSIQNQSIEGSDFLFDVYILRTNTTDIYLGDADFVMTFSSGNFTNPTISMDQQGAPGGRIETFYGVFPAIVSSNRAILNLIPPSFSTQLQFNSRVLVVSNTPPGDLIASVRITGITNPSGTMNLAWRLESPNNSLVFTFANVAPWNQSDITSGGVFVDPPNSPLPITLSSFTGQVLQSGAVRLDWATISEIENFGFNVERKRSTEQSFIELPNSFIPGHGTTNEPQHYTFTDATVSAGTWQYRLKQIDMSGGIHRTDPIQVDVLTNVKEAAPIEFALLQNYPNPFNPETEIKFSVDNTARATLRLYNLIGQEVETLFDGIAEAGQYYHVRLNGSSLASGVYFYRLQSETKSDLRKMILMR